MPEPPPPQPPPEPVTAAPPPPPLDTPSEQTRDSNYCFSPDGRDGSCVSIRSCRVLLTELQQRGHNPDYAQYLRNSNGICLYQPQVVSAGIVEPQRQSSLSNILYCLLLAFRSVVRWTASHHRSVCQSWLQKVQLRRRHRHRYRRQAYRIC